LAISPQYIGYTSNRLYNILASGGFCLTLWFPGIEDLFENKKHLVWFKTPEEAVKLARYYMEHPLEREKIAKQGHKEYLSKHTAQKRLDYMFDILRKL
jgi:spore maturation protein CgeB